MSGGSHGRQLHLENHAARQTDFSLLRCPACDLCFGLGIGIRATSDACRGACCVFAPRRRRCTARHDLERGHPNGGEHLFAEGCNRKTSDHHHGLWLGRHHAARSRGFGGSIAAAVAGYDHRIRAVHAQVVPLELRVLDRAGYAEGTKRARGELGYRTRSKNTYKRWRLVKRVSRAASIRQDPSQLSRCLVSRLDPPLKALKFESLPSTRSGTQRWSQTSTGCFAYALFYGVFGELFDGGRESLPLRHNKMGSRKPRQIRTSYTTGSAGVAPRVAPIMAR